MYIIFIFLLIISKKTELYHSLFTVNLAERYNLVIHLHYCLTFKSR